MHCDVDLLFSYFDNSPHSPVPVAINLFYTPQVITNKKPKHKEYEYRHVSSLTSFLSPGLFVCFFRAQLWFVMEPK